MIHGAVLVSAFFILWFLALFCLLPIDIGTVDPRSGAPAKPRLLLKVGFATAIAAVLWLIFYALILLRVVEL